MDICAAAFAVESSLFLVQSKREREREIEKRGSSQDRGSSFSSWKSVEAGSPREEDVPVSLSRDL